MTAAPPRTNPEAGPPHVRPATPQYPRSTTSVTFTDTFVPDDAV